MFDGTKVSPGVLVEPWKELRAPAGVYFVTGNHEEFGDPGQYLSALRGAGIRVLDNEKTTVQGLQIVGVRDGDARDAQLFRDILRAAELNPAQASILLAHQPSNLSIPAEAGISLQLSGHTHAGQFWPWTSIASRVHRQFVYGLNRFGRLWVLPAAAPAPGGRPCGSAPGRRSC